MRTRGVPKEPLKTRDHSSASLPKTRKKRVWQPDLELTSRPAHCWNSHPDDFIPCRCCYFGILNRKQASRQGRARSRGAEIKPSNLDDDCSATQRRPPVRGSSCQRLLSAFCSPTARDFLQAACPLHFSHRTSQVARLLPAPRFLSPQYPDEPEPFNSSARADEAGLFFLLARCCLVHLGEVLTICELRPLYPAPVRPATQPATGASKPSLSSFHHRLQFYARRPTGNRRLS